MVISIKFDIWPLSALPSGDEVVVSMATHNIVVVDCGSWNELVVSQEGLSVPSCEADDEALVMSQQELQDLNWSIFDL